MLDFVASNKSSIVYFKGEKGHRSESIRTLGDSKVPIEEKINSEYHDLGKPW
jgi:hypothetical protein